MKKLYEKSEILFAILWIVLYTVGMGNLRNLGDDSPYMMIGLIVLSALMLLFVWKNGLLEKYGLSAWARNNRAMLWFFPLWIIASMNLWGGVEASYPLPGQIFAVVSMALVGFAEELIFRGFLFKAVAFGFIVTLAFYKSGSLLPCILSHSLTDVFSKFARGDAPSLLNWAAHIVIVVLAVVYCVYLVRRVETYPINRPGTQEEQAPCAQE